MPTMDLMRAARMTPEEIAFHLGRGVRTGRLTGWAKGFGLSIMRFVKMGRALSPKQRSIANRLVEDLRHAAPDLPGEDTLIDDGDRE